LRISFSDNETRRMFNDYGLLEAQFGPELAVRIATRLAVLAAARDLGRVPRRPPIRLRPTGGGRGRFAVDLAPARRLLFTASVVRGRNGEERDVDEALVEEIEVSGVE